MVECIFCRILLGDLPGSFIFRDDVVAAFMDIQPVNAGHVLVVPLAHANRLADLTEDVAAHMMRVACRVAAAQRKSKLLCEGVDVLLADGKVAGQEVEHVHLHVFPRHRDDGFAFHFGPDYDVRPSREELDRIAAGLREVLL